MADRVPSDHETIETHRVRLGTVGRTSRPSIDVPDAIEAAAGDVVRLSFGGDEYHARVERGVEGTPQFRAAFDNARLARSDDGEDRLGEWLATADVDPGRSLLLDVLTDGYHYGLREPADRVLGR